MSVLEKQPQQQKGCDISRTQNSMGSYVQITLLAVKINCNYWWFFGTRQELFKEVNFPCSNLSIGTLSPSQEFCKGIKF